jgi:hypothetical protein
LNDLGPTLFSLFYAMAMIKVPVGVSQFFGIVVPKIRT